jgi:hypothetical protein
VRVVFSGVGRAVYYTPGDLQHSLFIAVEFEFSVDNSTIPPY